MRLALLLLILWVLLLAPAPGAAAMDCAQRFAPGAYGVPASDPAVQGGLLNGAGFRPIYLEKHSDEEEDAVCKYVTVYDVFRLSYREPRPLLAGCYGDFDGDGRRDYALLLQSVAGDEVIPHVFLAAPSGYRVIALPKVTDPYGFNEDRTLWPGPFCQKKPASGQYKVLEEGSVHVVGDVIRVGWYAYYWRPDMKRFEAVLVAD